MKKRSRNSGFTLVEILIVVIILGILAAIVIPQFTEASESAKLSSLRADLQTIRGQLQLYKVQHNDQYPPAATFSACMVGTTNSAHAAPGVGDTVLGPYLQQSFPENPFTGINSVRVDGAAAGAGTDGWRFDTVNGAFQADDTVAHSAL